MTMTQAGLDDALRGFGLKILRTPVRASTANAYCERLVGTVRRECLDFIIPLDEKHLRKLLTDWVIHYNQDSCQQIAGSDPRTFWVVFIMNTGLKKLPHDPGPSFCEHRQLRRITWLPRVVSRREVQAPQSVTIILKRLASAVQLRPWPPHFQRTYAESASFLQSALSPLS